MKLLSKIVIVLIVFSCFVMPVSAEIVDRIMAVVNHQVITLQEVQQAAQSLIEQGQDSAQLTEEKVVTFLIEQELVYQETENMDVLVTDEELNGAIEFIKRQNEIPSDEALKSILGKEGKTWEDFQNELRKQLKIERIISQEVRSKVEVTDAEIEAFYQAHLDEISAVPSAVSVRHILLNVPENSSDAEVQEIQAKAEQLVQQLRAGADFATLAKEFSHHPSAESGGELGTFRQGELAPPYDFAFTMDAGDISDPIRSAKGFHILYVEEKISGEQATREHVNSQIQARIFEEKATKRYEAWLKELKDKAFIEISE